MKDPATSPECAQEGTGLFQIDSLTDCLSCFSSPADSFPEDTRPIQCERWEGLLQAFGVNGRWALLQNSTAMPDNVVRHRRIMAPREKKQRA